MERLPKNYTETKELRESVDVLVKETLNNGSNYTQEGRWVREFVGLFIDENLDRLPTQIQISPNLSLETGTVTIQRKGQDPNIRQEEFWGIWFTHSGLIVNAIARQLDRL